MCVDGLQRVFGNALPVVVVGRGIFLCVRNEGWEGGEERSEEEKRTKKERRPGVSRDN